MKGGSRTHGVNGPVEAFDLPGRGVKRMLKEGGRRRSASEGKISNKLRLAKGEKIARYGECVGRLVVSRDLKCVGSYCARAFQKDRFLRDFALWRAAHARCYPWTRGFVMRSWVLFGSELGFRGSRGWHS